MALRTDIQALRGLAVLLVVFHHAKFGLLNAGYLGVDIFFVISGYLITGMIKSGIEQGTFRFAEFYFRRAKRLLPAAYVTFAVTALISLFLLSANELHDFGAQIIGAVTFTANIALWNQTGYFDGAATLKPLLHVWSLSIEEQYYLLLPAALAFIPQRFWKYGIIMLLLTSLALCMVLVQQKPSAVFYLLPTRAWELAIGSFAALLSIPHKGKTWVALQFAFWPSLAILFILPVMPLGTAHPGIDAFLVCLATAIVILRYHPAINGGVAPKALAKVGNFSYSLYLVHWPIFAFINNVYVGEPPLGVHISAVILALAIGFLLYRYVEVPTRHANVQISRGVIAATLGTSLLLAGTPGLLAAARVPEIDYAHVRRANVGFSMDCEYKKQFAPKPACQNTASPEILVWGDSFAMHSVPGIIATTDKGVMQATSSSCAPLLNLAAIDNAKYPRAFGEQCLSFNRSVYTYLAATPSIKTVVLSSPFASLLSAASGTDRVFRSLEIVNGKSVERVPSISGAVQAMLDTVAQVRALGKRVVIVAPPPVGNFDIGRCLERRANGQLTFGAANNCSVPVKEYHAKQVGVLDFLKQLEQQRVPVIYFDKILCSATACAAELDGTFIYRDSQHLSYDGSRLLAEKMGLSARLQEAAR